MLVSLHLSSTASVVGRVASSRCPWPRRDLAGANLSPGLVTRLQHQTLFRAGSALLSCCTFRGRCRHVSLTPSGLAGVLYCFSFSFSPQSQVHYFGFDPSENFLSLSSFGRVLGWQRLYRWTQVWKTTLKLNSTHFTLPPQHHVLLPAQILPLRNQLTPPHFGAISLSQGWGGKPWGGG